MLLMLQETLDFTGDVLMFLHSFWLKPGVLVVYMYIYIYTYTRAEGLSRVTNQGPRQRSHLAKVFLFVCFGCVV